MELRDSRGPISIALSEWWGSRKANSKLEIEGGVCGSFIMEGYGILSNAGRYPT